MCYKDGEGMYEREIMILSDVKWTDFKAIITFLGSNNLMNKSIYGMPDHNEWNILGINCSILKRVIDSF